MRFVEEVPTKVRTTTSKWDEVSEDLKGNVGSWGVIEEEVLVYRSQVARTCLGSKGNFEVKFRAGTVYARFLG